MTDERSIERVLDQWFATGPTELPDRVIDAVAAKIESVAQRSAWHRPWRPTMNTHLRFAVATVAALAAVLVIWNVASEPMIGPRPTASAPATPSTPPSLEAVPTQVVRLFPAAELNRLVVTEANVPAGLTVQLQLTGADALRAMTLLPIDQPGIASAVLTGFTRVRDFDPYSTGETLEAPLAARFLRSNGQYGSVAVLFWTRADAARAFAAAAATLQSPSGWGLAPEPDDLFLSKDWAPTTDWVPADGARYYQGVEYGFPRVRVYLWRVGNMLLFAADLHVYDLPAMLQGVVEGMDAEARRVFGSR